MNKKVAVLLTACVFTVGIFTACNKATPTTPTKTTTEKVRKGNLQIGLSSDARINISQTNLNFEQSGVVKKINVQVGQSVKTGDVLAELDGTDLNLAVTKAQNNLNKAQASYTDAVNQRDINIDSEKIKLDDAKAKYDAKSDDTSLKASYDLELKKYQSLVNSDASIQNAKLAVEDAKNNLQQAKNDLSKIYLKAPYDGKIMSIAYKEGELVSGNKAASSNSNSNSAFMVICDPNTIYVKASAAESDISGIENGQTMKVKIDALSLDNLTGQVQSVSNTPKIDSSGIVTYEVTGQLKDVNENIKDGMSCFATFLKKEKTDVLLISNKAIFMEDDKQYVNVKLDNGTTEKRAVTCGLTNGIQSEVVDGLKEGETIVIGGVQK